MATEDGKRKVSWKDATTGELRGENIFDTVLCAVGRNADTKNLGLESVGIKTHSSGKILANPDDTTNVPNIFAIGDVVYGRLELTPVKNIFNIKKNEPFFNKL